MIDALPLRPNSSDQVNHLRIIHSDQCLRTDLLEPEFPYGEDLLQFIWESHLFDQHALRTTQGVPVEVIKPGRIQRNSGPDLVDAQIRIGGQLWAGTVEVHLRSSEWNAHGHQYDPAYENVVLHVVYEHDIEVRTLNGKTLPTIELFPRISTESIAMHKTIMNGQGFVPCASQVGNADQHKVSFWLERVMIERLERRTSVVETLYTRLNYDAAATFHHMLMQAFGMKVNAEPFGMLAHALPLRLLQKYQDDPLRIEALLFGQAGFLQVDLIDEYPRRLQQEYALLTRLHELRSVPVAAWKFGRMRPSNFPTIRFAQFAALFAHLKGDLNALLQTENVNEIYAMMQIQPDDYWNEHYQFDRSSGTSPKKLGRMAIDHVIINAIVPTLFTLGRIQGRPSLQDRALALLDQLPAEKNLILENWASLGVIAGTAARGQALIELKNMYCNQRRCLSCVIGNELLRSTSPAR